MIIKVKAKIIRNNNSIIFITDENKKIVSKKKFKLNIYTNDVVLIEYDTNNEEHISILEIIEMYKNSYLGHIILVKKKSVIIKMNKFSFTIEAHKNKNLKIKKNDLISFKINRNSVNNTIIDVEILKNYGNSFLSGNILNSLINESGIPYIFNSIIKNEAIKIKSPIIENLLDERIDLRDKMFITIDDINAKDLDDAVYIEKNNDNYILYVSIADVSYFVKENSLIDLEAKKRGNSVYLVDSVIPMLPKRLSNKLCSLNPNEDKLCFTAKLTYNPKGKLIDSNFFKSIINSKYRLTYDGVNKMFEKGKFKIPFLKEMYELSKLLRNNKNKKGMINFNVEEIKLILDDNSNITKITKKKYGIAENIIEDFMVATNVAVAERLYFQKIPTIFRIHEKPDNEVLHELNKKLNILGYNINNISNMHPGIIAKIINNSKDTPNSYLINKLILKSMKKARYSNENLGHFAQSLDYYLHFTSPIRRYSDLIVHRMLEYAINSYDINNESLIDDLKNISLHISETEKIADKLEKDSMKLKILDYMKNSINKNFKAKIVGFLSNKVFLQLDNLIELVFYDGNSNEYSIINDTLISKNKKYSLGEYVNVKLIKLDYEKIEILVEVI